MLHTVGYAIFRGANRQKDIFRADPSDARVAHVKTLRTQRGRMLMVSGWWGLSRHINYFGDWLMGYACIAGVDILSRHTAGCAGAYHAGWTAQCPTFTPSTLQPCCVRAPWNLFSDSPPPSASGCAGRPIMSSKVRQGLGQVLCAGALQDHPLCVLMVHCYY